MARNFPIDKNPVARVPSIFYQYYKDHEPIGKGGFGTVFLATEKFSERRVAIKRVKLRIGTEKGVLEELRILSKLEHDNILRYYNSWSEPAEYHKERDEELFHQSGISKSPASATGGTSTGVGTTVDEIVIQRGSRTTDSNLSDIIFESSSSSGNQPAKSISKSSIDDTKSSQNDQPAKSISKSSIDDTKSSQNDQPAKSISKSSIDDTKSSQNDQPAKSISKSSIDDTKSSQNDQPAKSISKSSIDDTKSSQNDQPAKSISKSSIDDTKSSQNDQPAKSISKSSIDDTKSSQNDQTEEKEQKRSKSYEYLFIVTGLCKNESLGHRLLPENRSKNKISRFDALNIFNQIVEGVTYLHDTMDVIHCDLKPANILFSLGAGDTVKIADFGLALTQQALVPTDDDLNSNKNAQAAGTVFYMSPTTEPVSFKRDIYALGIILFELLYPVSSLTERAKVLEKIRTASIEFPDDFEKYGNEILKSLIGQLLSHSADARPTISDLKQRIRRRLELDGSEDNDDATVSKIENVLNSPIVKQLPLATDEIQYGKFDTSDQYLLLSDDNKLKLYNINCELIDEFSGLHESSQYVGFVQRIVWCEHLRQFLILCGYYLYAFTPSEKAKLTNMRKIHHIEIYRKNTDLRFITCTNKHVFINYSYHTIRQYDIPQWFLSREWSKTRLNYQEVDEIFRTTCSATNDYIAFNVRLDKCQWVVDVRRIDDNLTLLKRIQIPDLSIKHKLQLSSHEWLVSSDKNKFCVVNALEEESNLKIVETNIQSESDIYPRFFGNYFLVPIVKKQHNTELNENNTIQLQGVIYFYQWK